MRLYLVQHGEAKSKEEDPKRLLTDKGVRDVANAGTFLKPRGIRVGVIRHSTKVRAAQTASLLASAIEAREGVVECEGLAPLDPVEPVCREIEGAEEDLMIVGHLPFLSKLASMLIAGAQETPVIAFQQGGVVCLDRSEDRGWTVRWMVTPELLG
jgi:phosphohistidine phosphatase